MCRVDSNERPGKRGRLVAIDVEAESPLTQSSKRTCDVRHRMSVSENWSSVG